MKNKKVRNVIELTFLTSYDKLQWSRLEFLIWILFRQYLFEKKNLITSR